MALYSDKYNKVSIPVGGLMPVMANLAGAHTVPASGIVDGDGWQYCNGVAIPAGQKLSGSTPNLTDERFLAGSSSAGNIGGSNTLVDHTHGFSLTAAGQSGGTHDHQIHGYDGAVSGAPGRNLASAAEVGFNSSYGDTLPGGGSHTHSPSSVTGSVGTGSVPTSTDSRPKYISVKYLMRVR